MSSIAIIGASSDRNKFGNKAVRSYVQQGWTVYPVNPKETTIEGLQAYPSIRDVPQPVDRVSVYLPPAIGMTILEDIAAVKPAELFFNPGSESEELINKAMELGLMPAVACSIVDIGLSPAQFS